jgi:hypothetical protein
MDFDGSNWLGCLGILILIVGFWLMVFWALLKAVI